MIRLAAVMAWLGGRFRLELAFWIGFVLPFGAVFGIARTAFVLMACSGRTKTASPQA